VYKMYQNSLGDALDYADLVSYSYFLLEKNPSLLDYFRQIYRYVLVCDYQDLNWAWADGLQKFSDDFPGAEINLGSEDNNQHPCLAWAAWRIVNTIPGRENRGSIPLPSQEEYSSRVSIYEAKDPAEETAVVVKRILKLLEEGKSLEDISVIYWNKGAGKRVANALVKLGIDVRRQQMPIIRPVFDESEASGNHDDPINSESEAQTSIALLKWHQARGYKVKYLFVIGLDEDTYINLDIMPAKEQTFMRRQFYAVLKCVEEYLRLSYSMKRMQFGKWHARRRFALLNEIETGE